MLLEWFAVLINGLMIAKLKRAGLHCHSGDGSTSWWRPLIFYTDGRPIYRHRRKVSIDFCRRTFGIPTPVLLAVAIAVAAYLLVRYCALAGGLLPLVATREAARLIRNQDDRVKICVYCIFCVAFSIAGFVLMAASALPTHRR